MNDNTRQPLVSLIIPIYNSSKFLDLCLNSVIKQTYRNIEIILINDGSIDNSLAICKKYVEIDNRIVLINKTNEGVSIARNEGVRISRGEYLQFTDSDDYLGFTFIEDLMDYNLKYPDSLIITGFNIISYNSKKSMNSSSIKKYILFDNETFNSNFEKLYLNQYINPPFNKLFKASVLKRKKIEFNSQLDLGEDVLFNLEVIKEYNSFLVLPKLSYFYRSSNPKSLTKKYRLHKYEFQYFVYNEINSYLTKFNGNIEIIESFKKRYIIGVLNGLLNVETAHVSLEDFKLYLFNIRKLSADKIFIKNYPKIKYAKLHEKLLCFLINKKYYVIIYLIAKARRKVLL